MTVNVDCYKFTFVVVKQEDDVPVCRTGQGRYC